MKYLLLTLFIWTTTNAVEIPVNMTSNVKVTVPEEGDKTTLKPPKIEISANTNVSSFTQSTSDLSPSSSTSDLSSTSPQSIKEDLLSKNLINSTPKPLNGNLRNDSINDNPAMVMTEGGNSVSTVNSSVTSFQNSKDTLSKRILTENSHREIISGSVIEKKNATQNFSHYDDNSKLQNAEGISSMNKGKITARKGVNDPKLMNPVTSDFNEKTENAEHVTHPLVILQDDKPLTTVSTNITHERMSKPVVTDVSNESSIYPSKKMDYIVSIMCTAFSIPLLIVLAVYLYKKGADFWERRHYNRMDFLIEGIYNE